tara:strand:- start:877 stop:1158 length:282 start_codon:yes stop_codon:yes gene_type:complete
MTRKKSAEKTEDKGKARLADAKKKRKAAWEAQQAAENKEENSREEFRKFFVKIRSKLGLSQDMEGVIWTHFKSAGFDKKDKFEEGIKHFGYKL